MRKAPHCHSLQDGPKPADRFAWAENSSNAIVDWVAGIGFVRPIDALENREGFAVVVAFVGEQCAELGAR